MCFISMYSVLNKLSEYTYFYISKNITSYTFVVFKIIKSCHCILKNYSDFICYMPYECYIVFIGWNLKWLFFTEFAFLRFLVFKMHGGKELMVLFFGRLSAIIYHINSISLSFLCPLELPRKIKVIKLIKSYIFL